MSRRAFLSGAAVAATLPLAGCDQPVPGWLADALVPESVAAELGLRAFQEILQETPPARDPALQRGVAAIGERIVAASRSPYPRWQFVVLDSPQVNAFALPGGHVGVYTGMLKVAANEAQLAAVLGHGADRQPAFLSTHPSSDRRIEELKKLLTTVRGAA